MIASLLAAAVTLTVTPDYLGITVPPNIAPLNFDLSGDARVTLTSSAGARLERSGRRVRFGRREWRAFLDGAKGGYYVITVAAGDDGASISVTNRVAAEPIDPWLSYRLIAPSYGAFDNMALYERSLEDFTERTIYDTRQTTREQCVNCHTPCWGDPATALFHKRAKDAGTVISSRKYGLGKHTIKRASGAPGAGTYPAWHPSGDYIAFSVNETRQSFFLTDPMKIEVGDLQSDLILYSLADRKIHVIEEEPKVFECFPTWSPDGKTLYTARATVPFEIDPTNEMTRVERLFGNFAQRDRSGIRYNLVARTFDAKARTFSAPEVVIDSNRLHASFLFPRISPDGRWMVVTVASYGVFPIWHREADLAIVDLKSRALRMCGELNSLETDSYHGFSTNGRWLVLSSRRLDGNYTRPFFAHFDPATGRFSKPFLLPVEDPAEHDRRFLSYNIPEFMTGPVPHSPAALRCAQ